MLGRIFFFFNDTATTEIYTLSLHDALPIYEDIEICVFRDDQELVHAYCTGWHYYTPVNDEWATMDEGERLAFPRRSEEHTSALQSRQYLVCRLLLEKKRNRGSSPPEVANWG